jgi:hypothetical protein
MLRLLSVTLLVLGVGLAAYGQEFSCSISDFRVVGANEVRFLCNRPLGAAPVQTPAVQEMDGTGAVVQSLPAQFQYNPNERYWLPVILQAGQQLQPNHKYRLFVPGTDPSIYAFHTKADMTIADLAPANGRNRFRLATKVAIDWNYSAQRTIGTVEDQCNLLADLRIDHPEGDTDDIGQAVASTPTGPPAPNVQYCVRGFRNVLGTDLVVKPRTKTPVAPKDKASANLYAKLLSQAGPGAKPGWAADVKFAPSVANLGHGFFLAPQILVDIGFGKVEDNKTTNTAKFGLGVQGAVRWAFDSALAPQMSFETDRKGHHQNLLFDFDDQIFVRQLLHSVKDQHDQAYARAVFAARRKGDDDPDPESIPQPASGWQVLFFGGTEVGGALSADTVKSDDETASISRPTYRIARIRPKASFSYQYKLIDVGVSITPRYLFANEKVTRERQVPDPKDASKQVTDIYVKDARGLRAYGEATLNIALDRFGHVALSSTYKWGSLPPNFDKVQTVQTGILIRY